MHPDQDRAAIPGHDLDEPTEQWPGAEVLEVCGRLYTAVAEVRGFVHVAPTDGSHPSRSQTHGRTA